MSGPIKSGDCLAIRPPGIEPALSQPGELEADDVAGRVRAFLNEEPNLGAGEVEADGVAERVRALLREEPDLGVVDALHVARKLGLSSRTLSRKLDEQGTNFRTLLDAVRRDMALRELAAGALPLTEIARRLGFGNAPSFHRAFKRWTGTTIGEARRTLRAEPGDV